MSDPLVPYKVWTSDGSIEYLKGKHLPLFAISIMFLVFLLLPYTLLLTFGQCMRSLPTRRRFILRCIRSATFISIMDAYHAPYNKKHRYWTGLLLFVRCLLFLVFAFSYSDNQLSTNMYTTNLVLIGILSLKIFITVVYKSSLMNILENCFLLNLVILSATICYLKTSSDVICQCTSASISLVMTTFLGILTYHVHLQLNKMRCFISISKRHSLLNFPTDTPTPLLKKTCHFFMQLQPRQSWICEKNYWRVKKKVFEILMSCVDSDGTIYIIFQYFTCVTLLLATFFYYTSIS